MLNDVNAMKNIDFISEGKKRAMEMGGQPHV